MKFKCCACGETIPATLGLRQWWNQGPGYSVCRACAKKMMQEDTFSPAEFETQYGKEGENW